MPSDGNKRSRRRRRSRAHPFPSRTRGLASPQTSRPANLIFAVMLAVVFKKTSRPHLWLEEWFADNVPLPASGSPQTPRPPIPEMIFLLAVSCWLRCCSRAGLFRTPAPLTSTGIDRWSGADHQTPSEFLLNTCSASVTARLDRRRVAHRGAAARRKSREHFEWSVTFQQSQRQ